MKRKIPRLLISGLRGGSGKTLTTLAIISYLNIKKGLRVVPFKKGPDYIDAGWLAFGAGTPCYNLDSFIIPEEGLIKNFLKHSKGDISVIEGNRGLYDGMDVEGTYSTARLSKLLDTPVILIIDCTKVTRTAAAFVLGAREFDRELKIEGVVLNQVSGKRHESVIRDSIERYCSLPVVGAIPRLDVEELPERHMGLLPWHEHSHRQRVIELALSIAERYLDIDSLLKIAENHSEINIPGNLLDNEGKSVTPGYGSSIRVGIVKDSAFQFYYEENLEELRNLGAELVEINALQDRELPAVNCLYIGGGFPETNAIGLSENREFMESLRIAIEEGLPVYAECGGMMYLGREIIFKDKRYPMAGVIPVSFYMEERPVSHGYTVVEVTEENPFYPIGTVLRGHEFHYSRPVNIGELRLSFTMKRGDGIINKKDGICYKNLLATYTHVHAYGAKEWAEGLIKRGARWRERHA